jgi:small subunit ribosomal protein S17
MPKKRRPKMAQVKIGTVVSNKMPNTLIVKVVTKRRHPLYKKLITRAKKFKVHSQSDIKVGQKVKIIETKPISKDKHFKVLEVLD